MTCGRIGDPSVFERLLEVVKRALEERTAVVFYNVDLSGEYCRATRDYDAVVRYVAKRPHYTICIYDTPVEPNRALICAC